MGGTISMALERVSQAAPSKTPVVTAANEPRPRIKTAIAATDSEVESASGSSASESIQFVGNDATTTVAIVANRQLWAKCSTIANTASASSALDMAEIRNPQRTTSRWSIPASIAISSG
jgi:hypothetical protein